VSDFLRGRVLPHLGLKLISLALAAGLWLAVARAPVAEVAIDVPIEFRNIAENLEVVTESIPQAQIRLRGPEYLIREVKPADVHAELDLAGLKPGERTFDLTMQQVRHPRELEVVQIIPNQFHFSFDVRLTRPVEIHPRVVGSFASGYRIGQIVVDPPDITISGPRKRVEAVEAAITDPVDVSGTMDRASFVRHPYVSDPLVQVTTSDPVRITVIMEKTSTLNGGH
jgi:YbbR domain-containing protein